MVPGGDAERGHAILQCPAQIAGTGDERFTRLLLGPGLLHRLLVSRKQVRALGSEPSRAGDEACSEHCYPGGLPAERLTGGPASAPSGPGPLRRNALEVAQPPGNSAPWLRSRESSPGCDVPSSSSRRGPTSLRRIRKRLGRHTRQQLSDEISEREFQARSLRRFLTRVVSASDPESESS